MFSSIYFFPWFQAGSVEWHGLCGGGEKQTKQTKVRYYWKLKPSKCRWELLEENSDPPEYYTAKPSRIQMVI